MWKLLGLSDPISPLVEAIGMALLALAVLAGTYLLGFSQGTDHEQAKALEAHNRALAAKASDVAAAASAAVRVEYKYIDRVRTIYKQGAAYTKEVPVYVPASTPDLPAGFRVLHDAAATGRDLDRAPGVEAESVPAQDLARTIVDNYSQCRELAERHAALIDVVEEFEARQAKGAR